jgi:CheY-like chemotaxis protein
MAAASSASTERDRRIIRVLLVEDETVPRVCKPAREQNLCSESSSQSRYMYVVVMVQAVATALLNAVAGVELDVAVDGAEAVRRVRERVASGAGAYDLILSDRQMPVTDGHEVRVLVRRTRAPSLLLSWHARLTDLATPPARCRPRGVSVPWA